jgi:hemerythrin-like domain-containing protein
MKPTEVLVEEHNAIKKILRIVEEVNRRLEAGEKVDTRDLIAIVDFIQGFADACHHRKEEGVLFPAMEAAGIPLKGGPIGVMLQEHEQGRAYVKAMKEAAAHINSSKYVEQFVENARGYVGLLQQHIMKEDNVLYPMAERRISSEEMDEIMEEFERVEQEETGVGVHERYHKMLHELAEKYLDE